MKRRPAATGSPWVAILRVPVSRFSMAGVLALQIGSTPAAYACRASLEAAAPPAVASAATKTTSREAVIRVGDLFPWRFAVIGLISTRYPIRADSSQATRAVGLGRRITALLEPPPNCRPKFATAKEPRSAITDRRATPPGESNGTKASSRSQTCSLQME